MGGGKENECQYSELVVDLQDKLEAAHRDVRQCFADRMNVSVSFIISLIDI